MDYDIVIDFKFRYSKMSGELDMWNLFKKEPKPVIRAKDIDWDKVKTVKDMVAIFKNLGMTRQITVYEEAWNSVGIDHLLTNKTYVNVDGVWKEESEK